jgi:hypothetical protein
LHHGDLSGWKTLSIRPLIAALKALRHGQANATLGKWHLKSKTEVQQ